MHFLPRTFPLIVTVVCEQVILIWLGSVEGVIQEDLKMGTTFTVVRRVLSTTT